MDGGAEGSRTPDLLIANEGRLDRRITTNRQFVTFRPTITIALHSSSPIAHVAQFSTNPP